MKYLIILLLPVIACNNEPKIMDFKGSSTSFFLQDTMPYKWSSVGPKQDTARGKWYSVEPDYKPRSAHKPVYSEVWYHQELESKIIWELSCDHNNVRLWSVALKEDTAYIMPTMADSLFKKCRVIEAGGRIFEAKN